MHFWGRLAYRGPYICGRSHQGVAILVGKPRNCVRNSITFKTVPLSMSPGNIRNGFFRKNGHIKWNTPDWPEVCSTFHVPRQSSEWPGYMKSGTRLAKVCSTCHVTRRSSERSGYMNRRPKCVPLFGMAWLHEMWNTLEAKVCSIYFWSGLVT